MTPQPLIVLEQVAVGYAGCPVLRDVNATIAPGDSIGVLGANGSGKTTLLKTIAGVLPAVGGQMRFPENSRRPAVGYVPQRESLDNSFLLSSFEVVLMGACGSAGPGRFLRRDDRAWARDCMERTGAADLARQPFAELSGGQKQRILIARALVAKPELLLLDEPTAGVDASATRAIAEMLQRLNADGMTIVMVNHDLPVVRQVARRIFWVKEGDLEVGSVREMLNAQHLEQLPVE
ncbi:MAG: metal ABC transporter ATP-binding protein [Limisphaerales bacterium]